LTLAETKSFSLEISQKPILLPINNEMLLKALANENKARLSRSYELISFFSLYFLWGSSKHLQFTKLKFSLNYSPKTALPQCTKP
jgi:hypothetical protein